jgi:cytochrome c553
MKRRKMYLLVAVAVTLLFLIAAAGQSVSAAPKRIANAKAGDCAACHGKDKVLPDSHPATKGMDWKACQACHKEGKMTLAGKVPGSHIHQLTGVNCAACHGKTRKPAATEMKKCVGCHGSTAKLAEKTAGVKPENPHTSPHYGTDLDCNLCHHQHAKSENYCNQCHKFDFKVP